MPGPAPLRVLVVDDVPDIVEGLRVILQLEGHTVATAENAADAVILAVSFQPDVVLLDLGLPEITGYDAAQRIRQLRGAEPLLIAISGWTRVEDRERAREAGFDHYLTKPIDFAELMRLLSSRRQKAEGP